MPAPRFQTKPIALAFGIAGTLPTEFRLFVRGWNASENGTYLFDDAAARLVVEAYQKWGVDLAIDLEHQMLSDAGPDPSARDARGWCKLELRSDGSLWAVDVKWTPDGAERLSQKRQRYISPAFEVDPETKRITKILNVAITSIPATHNTPALVAASLNGVGMDPKKIAEALDALIAGDDAKCAELLKGIIAAAAGAEAPAEPVEEAVETPAPEMESAEPPPVEEPSEEEKNAVAPVAMSRLARLTGKATVVEALDEVEVWRASFLEREQERVTLAAERATLETAERKRLCIELIHIGAEFPPTVWTDDKATTLLSRWTAISLAELQTHVKTQRAARGTQTRVKQSRGAGVSGAPAVASDGSKTYQTPHGAVTLNAHDHQICADAKCDPAVYAALKARRSTTETG